MNMIILLGMQKTQIYPKAQVSQFGNIFAPQKNAKPNLNQMFLYLLLLFVWKENFEKFGWIKTSA